MNPIAEMKHEIEQTLVSKGYPTPQRSRIRGLFTQHYGQVDGLWSWDDISLAQLEPVLDYVSELPVWPFKKNE